MNRNDLTQGNLSLHLIRLALPLMLGNILQQMYNTIASLVVNRYAGELEYAATGVSSSVMNLFLFVVIGDGHGEEHTEGRGLPEIAVVGNAVLISVYVEG